VKASRLIITLGDIGGIMLLRDFRDMFPSIAAMDDPTLHTVTLTGTVIGCWNLGCLVGAVLTFFLCNILGRRGCIMAGLAIEIIGKIVQCTSFTLGQYIAGRVIAGVGNG
jgi:MFS family permease